MEIYYKNVSYNLPCGYSEEVLVRVSKRGKRLILHVWKRLRRGTMSEKHVFYSEEQALLAAAAAGKGE